MLQREHSGLGESQPQYRHLQIPQGHDLIKKATTSLVLKAPKTESSNRVIYLSHAVIDELRAVRMRQEQYKAMLGEEYQDYDLVVAQINGRPYEQCNIDKMFYNKQNIHKAGIITMQPGKIQHRQKGCRNTGYFEISGVSGTLERTRTSDLPLRRRSRYPLRYQGLYTIFDFYAISSGRPYFRLGGERPILKLQKHIGNLLLIYYSQNRVACQLLNNRLPRQTHETKGIAGSIGKTSYSGLIRAEISTIAQLGAAALPATSLTFSRSPIYSCTLVGGGGTTAQ